MIILSLDKEILFYYEKSDISNIQLISKYYYNLINNNWYSIAYKLLESQGYSIYKYGNTISIQNKSQCISTIKKNIIKFL